MISNKERKKKHGEMHFFKSSPPNHATYRTPKWTLPSPPPLLKITYPLPKDQRISILKPIPIR